MINENFFSCYYKSQTNDEGLETNFCGLGLEVMRSRSHVFLIGLKTSYFLICLLLHIIVMNFAICLKAILNWPALPQFEVVKSLEPNFFNL